MKIGKQRLSMLITILVVTFSSCQKENIRNGNKHIIGDWVLESAKIENIETATWEVAYDSSPCGFEDFINL